MYDSVSQHPKLLSSNILRLMYLYFCLSLNIKLTIATATKYMYEMLPMQLCMHCILDVVGISLNMILRTFLLYIFQSNVYPVFLMDILTCI